MSNIFDQQDNFLSEREAMEETNSESLEDQGYDMSVLDQYNEDPQESEESQDTQVRSFNRISSNKKVAFSLSEQEKNTMNSATIRLEQARLYEMLMKHDLFSNIQANQLAINNVKRELKAFLLEKLQILMGMKAAKEVEEIEVEVYSQFNSIEVDFLKALAITGTKGQSNNGESFFLQTNKKKVTSVQKKEQYTAEENYGDINPIVQEPREERQQVKRRAPIKQVTPPIKQVIKKSVSSIQKPTDYEQAEMADNMPQDVIMYHAKKEAERQKRLGSSSNSDDIYAQMDEDYIKERLGKSKPRKATSSSAIKADNDMANLIIQSNQLKTIQNDPGLSTIMNVLSKAKR